jgi:hypothetical protein
VVAGAALEAVNTATGQIRKAVSDSKGEFTIPNLVPSSYEITVVKDGFRTVKETNIVLRIGQVARMDFKLAPGTVTQVLEVSAEVQLINAENAIKGQVMVSNEIAEMPLNGRDFSDLALLVPGVLPVAAGSQGSNFNINGARADNTNFNIDGLNDQSPRVATPQATPNIDALEEF